MNTQETIFKFLDAQEFTTEEAADLDYVIDKVRDYADYTGDELKEVDVVDHAIKYVKKYRQTVA